jgi:hypothetical protein
MSEPTHGPLCSCQPCIQKQKEERVAQQTQNAPSEPYYTPHSWELPEYEVPNSDDDTLTKWTRADEQETRAWWIHAQEQAFLENEFKAALGAFYDAEDKGTPISIEIHSDCHRTEGALLFFLQKTMSEEAARVYISVISAGLDK